ncbi:MAG: HAD family hydrolase [Vicinamibacterales bacterium]
MSDAAARPPSAHRPALIVFDLDGTLVDSRKDIADAANDLLRECGAAPLPDRAIARMVGEGAATLVARAFTAAGAPQPADALQRYLRFYDRRLLLHTKPYDGIAAMLDALHPAFTLAVLTNKPIGATRQILDGLDLARYFDARLVLGGDGPHARKPDPAGFLQIAEACGVGPERALMVGDSVIDRRTARAAGASACVARYGFGFELFPTDELLAGDLLIDAPQQLVHRLGPDHGRAG